MMIESKPAVVLLSGGLDSATTLAMAMANGFDCHALSFDYGQRHGVELKAAVQVGRQLRVKSHRTIKIDPGALRVNGLSTFGGSALTGDLDVPKDREPHQISDGVPVTYVPARNTVFLSYGLAFAELLGSADIFIGVNAVDYSGYPDCRPQFIEAFQRMANLATKSAVEGRPLVIHTPLISLSKTQIIRQGLELGVDYAITHSCYDPLDDPIQRIGCRPCGRCDACLIRLRAFESLGQNDPACPA